MAPWQVAIALAIQGLLSGFIPAAVTLTSVSVPDAPPRVLLDKIARGELGARTGKGLYTYPNPAFPTAGWLKGDEN
jgi:3-hydroxyacyl-CoA dehydrogenase